MEFDYNKLRGRIREVCGTEGRLAEKIGLSPRSMSLKLHGKRYFKQNEIGKIINELELTNDDIGIYFFYSKGLNNQTNRKE